ncbi:MAG: hypothetical protein ACOC2H_09465 [Spirochaetota bacterium]
MTCSAVEWFGYAASSVVAVSLMMSSIVKLRWYNLAGASLFSVYGLLIGSFPVFFLNAFIAGADVYYLIKLYRTEEHFSLLEITSGYEYAVAFLEYNRDDIRRIFPDFNFTLTQEMLIFLLLRDAVPAGMLIGRHEDDSFQELLDYVTPSYRDLKLAQFILKDRSGVFTERGIRRFRSEPYSSFHEQYLQRVGFSRMIRPDGSVYYEYLLSNG